MIFRVLRNNIFDPTYRWVKKNPLTTAAMIGFVATASLFTAGAALMPMVALIAIGFAPYAAVVAASTFAFLKIADRNSRWSGGQTLAAVIATVAVVAAAGLVPVIGMIVSGIVASVAGAAILAGLAASIKACFKCATTPSTRQNHSEERTVSNSHRAVGPRVGFGQHVAPEAQDELKQNNDNQRDNNPVVHQLHEQQPSSRNCFRRRA